MLKKNFLKTIYPLKDKLFRFAFRILNSKEEAEDIVQEVMVKLWKDRQNLENYNNKEAYCMQVVKNNCLDNLRHQKVRITAHKEISQNNSYQTGNLLSDNIDLHKLVEKTINNLPEKQKMIMHLRDIEAYSFKEIANVMNMDINSIRVNLFRARKKVKEHILKLVNYGV